MDEQTEKRASGRTKSDIPYYAEMCRCVMAFYKKTQRCTLREIGKSPDMRREIIDAAQVDIISRYGVRVSLATLDERVRIIIRELANVRKLRAMRCERGDFHITYPSLEERVVMRLYLPHVHEAQFRNAIIGSDTRTNIVVKRGEPDVKVDSINHGYGYYAWTERTCTITFPKGWSYLAREGRHLHGTNKHTAIISRVPEQPDLLQMDWNPSWTLEKVQYLHRHKGAGKSLSDVVYLATAGNVQVEASHPALACEKLVRTVIRKVKKLLEV